MQNVVFFITFYLVLLAFYVVRGKENEKFSAIIIINTKAKDKG